LPVFPFDKVLGIVESAKTFLNSERNAAPDVEQRKKQAEKRKNVRQPKVEEIKSKKRDTKPQFSWVKKEHSAAKAKADRPGQTSPQAKKVRKKKQELSRLKSGLRRSGGRRASRNRAHCPTLSLSRCQEAIETGLADGSLRYLSGTSTWTSCSAGRNSSQRENARAKERGPLRVPCRTPEAHPYLPRPAQL
jgi:hypothetical protein